MVMLNRTLGIFAKWLIISLSLFAAAFIVKGVEITDFWAGLAAGALLGIVNSVVRPVLVFLTLPITVISLGLFILVINALMLQFVAWAIEGFSVSGFWAAFFGSLVVSVVSWVINQFFGNGSQVTFIRGGGRR